MEGVTDTCFRDAVFALHPPSRLAAAFTEFVRVVAEPIPAWVLRRNLGEANDRPVGLQLMGNRAGPLAGTVEHAVEVGAPIVDLNFGCPARGAVRGCAGSALLAEPRTLTRLVAACVRAAAGRVPVSAKVRAGIDDDRHLEDIVRAVEDGGAAFVTVHARTRADGYAEPARWGRLRRAAASVSIPVCGNGGVELHRDIQRLPRETGCMAVMVGRAALADPWVFSGEVAGPEAAREFLVDYDRRMSAEGRSERARLGRLKQLLGFWRVGSLVRSVEHRGELLRERDRAGLFRALGVAPDPRLRPAAEA